MSERIIISLTGNKSKLKVTPVTELPIESQDFIRQAMETGRVLEGQVGKAGEVEIVDHGGVGSPRQESSS